MYSHLQTLPSHRQLDTLERRVINGGWWPVLSSVWLLFCSCMKKQNFRDENKTSQKSRWCKWFLTVKLRSLFADDVSSGFGVLVLVVPGCGRPGNRRCVTVDMTRWRWAINCAHFVLQISENIKSHLHTSAYCRLKCSQYVRGGGWFAMHVLAVLWPWTWAAVMVDRFGFLWR